MSFRDSPKSGATTPGLWRSSKPRVIGMPTCDESVNCCSRTQNKKERLFKPLLLLFLFFFWGGSSGCWNYRFLEVFKIRFFVPLLFFCLFVCFRFPLFWGEGTFWGIWFAPWFVVGGNLGEGMPSNRFDVSQCHTLECQPFESLETGVWCPPRRNDPMAEGESEHDGALKRYVSKVQEHREFESRVKKLRETVTWFHFPVEFPWCWWVTYDMKWCFFNAMKDFRFWILWSDGGEIVLYFFVYSAAFAAQTHVLSDASAFIFFYPRTFLNSHVFSKGVLMNSDTVVPLHYTHRPTNRIVL